MEKLQEENKYYILYSPDTLKYINDNIDKVLIPKIEEYKKIFKLENFKQIQINYFDDIEKFRNYIYKIRGENKSLPTYAAGTYDLDMINVYIDIKSNDYETKKIYIANHELFHILYKKNILNDDMSKRIVWYDEGMAQYLSGEKDYLLNEEEFKEYYNTIKNSTNQIPNLNNLKHGKTFKNEDYNAYDLSYLSIRYLKEILNDKEFFSLMSDFNKILEYGNNITKDMFDYYDNILNKKGIKRI